MIAELKVLGIDTRGKLSGKAKCICPQCNSRRTNKKDRSLSVDIDQGLYHCHYCQWSGSVAKNGSHAKKYRKPILKGMKPTERLYAWFENRGISRATVDANGITCRAGSNGLWATFPYNRGGETINAKHRNLSKKGFMQEAECESIFWGLDTAGMAGDVIIVEGEIDLLSFHEAGIKNVLSVPQGGSDSLKCINNCFEYFDNDRRILICADKDEIGAKLEESLLRRFGRDRCAVIDLPEGCKDPNDVIRPDGPLKDLDPIARVQTLASCARKPRELPIVGVLYLDGKVRDRMLDQYKNGRTKGSTTHFERLDGIYTWLKGHLKVMTGIPNHGKSEFELQLMLVKSIRDGWKWGVFSPESYPPEEFYDNLAHAYIGIGTDPERPENYCTEVQYSQAMDFLHEHFFFVYPDGDQEPETIRKKFKSLILRHDIDGVLIDPWNQLDHIIGDFRREDLYLSHELKECKRFALEHHVCFSIIAHPVKMQKIIENGKFMGYRVPDAYDLSGGSMWNNKADIIGAVHRPQYFEDKMSTIVEVHYHKIKNQKRVGIPGNTHFDFSRSSHRYYEAGISPLEKPRIEPVTEPTQADFEEFPW